jgi:hypothetical protein
LDRSQTQVFIQKNPCRSTIAQTQVFIQKKLCRSIIAQIWVFIQKKLCRSTIAQTQVLIQKKLCRSIIAQTQVFIQKKSLQKHYCTDSGIHSNKPFRTLHLNRINSKTPFNFQLIVGSKQMHQTKPQQVLVDAWLSNTISGHGPNSHESSCTSQLVVHSKYLKSHETSCIFPLEIHAKCLISQALCIAFGTLACPSVASTNIIKANSDVGNLLFQIFINIKADSNFIRYSSSVLWQMNKMCGAS